MTDGYSAWRTLEGVTHFGCLAQYPEYGFMLSIERSTLLRRLRMLLRHHINLIAYSELRNARRSGFGFHDLA
nr:hypothetical protein [Cupriavidus sp. P-10]